jgi:hypothetical protein
MVDVILRRGAVLAAVSLILLLTFSCEGSSASSDSSGRGASALVISAADGDPAYVSLSSGTVLADAVADTTDWDLKFTYDRTIHTNSGYTASASGDNSSGCGGVYYAGSASSADGVSSATFEAAKTVFDGGESDWPTNKHFEEYHYFTPTAQMGTWEGALNIMTYHGYATGSGTDTDPWVTYEYNADGFYTSAAMGEYIMTNNVYIIRHGDGSKHTAVQVTAMETSDNDRVYQIKYYTLD